MKNDIKYHNFPVIDLGCGLAGYTNHFYSNNIESLSIDGNPYLQQHARGRHKVGDLVKDKFEEKSPIVVSLEVYNHIPKNMSNDALFNLRKISIGYLIMSWATPEQGGPNQLNPLSRDQFISVIRDLGYKYHDQYSNYLRNACSMPWLKNTITVFESL